MSYSHPHLTSTRYRLTLADEAGTPVPGGTVTITAIRVGRHHRDALLAGYAFPLATADNGDGTYDYFPPAENGFRPGRTYRIEALGVFPGGLLQVHMDATITCR